MTQKAPKRIAVTGAAGQIAYALLFRIASGELLGPDQPVILQLLEIPPALDALEGVRMELDDCAYPLLYDIIATSDAREAFNDVDIAFLIGAKPRSKGMDRSDLLQGNAQIFKAQGEALNSVAKRDVRVLVVGNPANTNALITMSNAPDLEQRHFTAMTRLDHNRCKSMLARHAGVHMDAVKRVTVWGNHSNTMFPDIAHALVDGKAACDIADQHWCENVLVPMVQNRGAEIIKARGLSSAASAAFAALDDVHDWCNGTEEGDWISMAVPSDGSYGIPEGLIYSFPVTVTGQEYKIVQGLSVSDAAQAMLEATAKELQSERDAVRDLLRY